MTGIAITSPSPARALAVLPQATRERVNLTIQTSRVLDASDDVFSSNTAFSATNSGWSAIPSPVRGAPPVSPSPSASRARIFDTPLVQKKPELTDKDFPPLGPMKGERKLSGGYWVTKNETDNVDECVISYGSLSVF